MQLLPFLKMQGLGNDFIVVDDLDPKRDRIFDLTPQFAERICDRRFGVGADQVLWLRKPHGLGVDIRMEILNSDGSIAEMCGNGIRAVAIYLARHSVLRGRASYLVETLAGVKQVEIDDQGHVKVDMGAPTVGRGVSKGGEMLSFANQEQKFLELNMGNPHAVFIVNDVSQVPLEQWGSAVENHARFPERTNVEFVQVLAPDSIKVRVWERGAGVTLACGTGACASAVATLITGRTRGKVKVSLPGGDLFVSWVGEGQPVIMEGPAEEVFWGSFKL